MTKFRGKSADQVFELIARILPRQKRKMPLQKNMHRYHLPPRDVDLSALFTSIIPDNLEFDTNSGTRADMKYQMDKIRYENRGHPEIVALHMQTISYLRRRTEFTSEALFLFNRMWQEHNDPMLALLPARDLVSALRTFADHSADRSRALIAKLGFQYATFIKVYESERHANNLAPTHANYTIPTQVPKIGVRGLFGVPFGRDNSLEILNVQLSEEIQDDHVVGPMVATLLRHVYDGDTAFSRVDNARVKSGFDLEKGQGWSFGFDPSDVDNETP